MADDVPSQGRFIGWLALALMIFAILAAAVALYASTTMPPAMT